MRNKLMQFLKQLGLHHLLRISKKGQLTVLSLHRITDEAEPFFEPVRPALFEQLLAYVSRHYTVTTFARAATTVSKKPLLVLSFDDGYYDFIEYALPLLRKFRMPANHNLVNACLNGNFLIWTHRLNTAFTFLKAKGITGDKQLAALAGTAFTGDWFGYHLRVFKNALNFPLEEKLRLLDELEGRYGIEPQARMITWDEAARLPEEEVEIGCHTYHHDSLNQITDTHLMDAEILASKTELATRLNRNIDIIAFPNGQSNSAVIDYCVKHGFKYLLHVDNKTTPVQELSGSKDGISVSRIGLNNESYSEMILRAERFHPKLQKTINKFRK